jgi:dihydroorotase
MLDQVNNGKLTIQKLVYHLSERPAQVFKMYPKKGSLMVGADADLTVVDMDVEWTIKAENMYSKSRDTSMFDGWKVKGKPVLTVVRGDIIAENGVVVGEEGYGQFQKRLS